jgi:DNA-binding PadR family transcriptional regulator
MAKRASSGNEVLLGMLTIEPMSGYDLSLAIRSSIGFFWSESFGQIYPNLRKMAAQGLVTCKTEKRKGKPDRQVYSITAKGRKRLREWLGVEPQPEIPRNELLLKLFFGPQAPAQSLIAYVERMAENERELLERFERIEREELPGLDRYPGMPYWKMAARFGQLELEAHLRWAEETLRELRKLGRKEPALSRAAKENAHAGK